MKDLTIRLRDLELHPVDEMPEPPKVGDDWTAISDPEGIFAFANSEETAADLQLAVNLMPEIVAFLYYTRKVIAEGTPDLIRVYETAEDLLAKAERRST